MAALVSQSVMLRAPKRMSLQSSERAARLPVIRNRRSMRISAATSAQGPPMCFHLGDTSISFPFTGEEAKEMKGAMVKAMAAFKIKAAAERPQRMEMVEYVHKGDELNGGVFVEVFCNPNAYADAFQAKVLITVRKQNMKFTSEGLLSAVNADIEAFIEQAC